METVHISYRLSKDFGVQVNFVRKILDYNNNNSYNKGRD